MSSSSPRRVPRYRRHKPSGQAVVTIDGRDVYLGKWGTVASRTEYDRLIGEWLAGGRCLPQPDGGVTVAELARAYWEFAKGYYPKPGSRFRVKRALRVLRERYVHTLARDFGPLALQTVQQQLVDAGNCRRYVNYLADALKRVFKWGVAQELVPETTYRALACVSGLRRGRTSAPDHAPVGPVADEVVDATLPRLPEVVADMVRVQRLTGARPGEVCIIRPADVDTSGKVWLYRPESHKTEYAGRRRVIPIGPRAQDVLRRYLLRPAETYCFVPMESERKRLTLRHAARKTPIGYGNRPGTNRRRRPKRGPGQRYKTREYCNAVRRAVEKENKLREKEAADRGEVELLPKWTPNRLRHSTATMIRKHYGLEGAQVALGHAHANVTEVYAERDLDLAVKIAREVG